MKKAIENIGAFSRAFVSKFTKEGRELPDPKPLELPAGMKRPETLQEQIRRMIRSDVSTFATDHGAESFDEANDFDMEDDDAELSATHHELHEEVVDEVKRVRHEDEERRRAIRGSDREERGASSEEGVSEEADSADSRAHVSRSKKSGRPSPQRRPTGRREEGGREESEVSAGRGRPDRSRGYDDHED